MCIRDRQCVCDLGLRGQERIMLRYFLDGYLQIKFFPGFPLSRDEKGLSLIHI